MHDSEILIITTGIIIKTVSSLQMTLNTQITTDWLLVLLRGICIFHTKHTVATDQFSSVQSNLAAWKYVCSHCNLLIFGFRSVRYED